MKSRWILASALSLALSFRPAAAEPDVEAKDLPRIPPTEPDKALSTFRIKKGFRLELVAAEPLVVDPIAMAFDEDGRLFVVEMGDYSERRPERLGRIRRLEDTNGDGHFDRSTVYVDHLPWPTAIICYGGGVFVGATPDILFCKDTNDDGVADVREVIFTGFASDYAPYETNRLNVQALMNSFNWGLDNRIHGSASMSGGKVIRADSPFVREWVRKASTGSLAPRGVFVPATGTSGNEIVKAPPRRLPSHEPHPLTPSLSPTGGEGGRRPGEGESGRESVPGATPHTPIDLRGKDFSFDPRTLEIRSESGGAQHGMSFDDRGRKFVCSNSDHIQLVMYEDGYAGRNPVFAMPPARMSIAADGPAAEVFRISPDEPWRVIRTKWRVAGLVPGPVEGGGRPSGYFTGATGTTIYRGDVLPEEFVGDAFIADCGSNLVHRKKLRPDGVGLRAERPDDERKIEFLASTDNWFRPVQFANAPDGTLYIADMYREVIEHPWSLPKSIKNHLDLNSGSDRGRIYRVTPERFKQRRPPRLGKATTKDLVKLLEHPNGWHRDTAARLLYERQDPSAVPLLERQLNQSQLPLARMHALHALSGLRALQTPHVRKALADKDEAVCEHALRLSEQLWVQSVSDNGLDQQILGLADDPSPRVRYQVAFTLGESRFGPAKLDALVNIVRRGAEDAWVRAAVLSSLRQDAGNAFELLSTNRHFCRSDGGRAFLRQLADVVGARNDSAEIAAVLRLFEQKADEDTALGLACALGEGLRRAGSSLVEADSGGRLRSVFARAKATVNDPSTSEPTRVQAIQLLAMTDFVEAGEVLSPLLDSTQPQAVQFGAVSALARFNHPGVGELLLNKWPQFTPRVRGEVIAVMLTRPERVRALLKGVERETVLPSDFTALQLQTLRDHRDPEIREAAARHLGAPAAGRREEAVKTFLPALPMRGDPAKGKTIYLERCASCHRIGSQGYPLGPDLTTVKTAGKEKLLVGILDPNREVAPNFLSFTVETKSGETLSGMIASETAGSLTLRGPNGVETVVLRSRIERLQSSGQSLMPEGLEAGLAPQDMADLLEYLGVAD
jgi:putative membrane-bound dehydrogenase-like protein